MPTVVAQVGSADFCTSPGDAAPCAVFYRRIKAPSDVTKPASQSLLPAFSLTNSCALFTREDPACAHEHSYITLGIGRTPPRPPALLSRAWSQPPRHPTRECGAGEGIRAAAGASRSRARAEGAGRAARTPRRPLASFPHLAPLLPSLLSVRGSWTHVCKSVVCVCVCACARMCICSGKTVSLGSDRPQCAQGAAARATMAALLSPSWPPQPFPPVSLGR